MWLFFSLWSIFPLWKHCPPLWFKQTLASSNKEINRGGNSSSNVTSASNDHQQPQDETTCNCTGRMGPCPLEGDCRKEKNIIYCCKVTRQDTMETETYTGLTANTFKARYYGHNTTFNNRDAKQTTLSKHCWNLKDNNIPFSRKWSILSHAKPYNPVKKVCRLFLKEVYFILYKPETASLN